MKFCIVESLLRALKAEHKHALNDTLDSDETDTHLYTVGYCDGIREAIKILNKLVSKKQTRNDVDLSKERKR